MAASEKIPAHLRTRGSMEASDRREDYPPIPEALDVGVFDNHAHLEIADGENPLDFREHLDRAGSVGVQGVVQVGTNVPTSLWSADVAATEPRVLAAVAIHPNEAPELHQKGTLDDALQVIDDLAKRPRVVAIGESGLDFFRTEGPMQQPQRRSFIEHIRLAKAHNLALQIHDRDAHQDVVDTLIKEGAPERTVFHCYSGDRELAEILNAHGWYASFAGTVTFGNAKGVQESLAVIDKSHILIETDTPFLTPTPHRGKPNSPYLIPHTLRFMARHLDTDVNVLAAHITDNTFDVYGRWDDNPPTIRTNPITGEPWDELEPSRFHAS